MKIGIIGATGMAGQDIFKEAVKRGHEVTALIRNEAKAKELLGSNIKTLVKDAFELTEEDLKDFDVIVNCFSTAPPKAYLHIDLTAKLISFFREREKPRLFFILGAGSLHTGEDKHLCVEDIKNIPDSASWINIPIQQLKQLRFLQEVDNVNWVGVSPSFMFVPGPDKGVQLGKDELLYCADGESHTTSGTMATAILNEIESPKHIQERFTVADT